MQGSDGLLGPTSLKQRYSGSLSTEDAKFGTQWQETEQLVCMPCLRQPQGSSSSSPGQRVLEPRQSNVQEANSPALLMAAMDLTVTLQPGWNLVAFQVAALAQIRRICL